MTILVTGGAGFIGANFVLDWLAKCDESVVNLDKLTYAGNLENLASLQSDLRHIFVRGDISDFEHVKDVLARHQPRAVLNFAAESHVDRSIHGPEDFIQTNVVGTFRLLEAVRAYWQALPASDWAAVSLGRPTIDLEDTDSLGKVIRETRPNVVVNAVAYTAVDYEADPLECPRCKGRMRDIALIEDPGVIQRILEHLGLWTPLATGRSPPLVAATWPRHANLPLTYHPVPDIA
jgi:dTDP-4-dehydrorhamnose reductase